MSIKFDIKFKLDTSLGKLKSVYNQVQALPQEAYNYFVSVTPIDTGNARSKTSLKGKSIEANYAYADRLDKGWSKQAPQGMVKPTQDYINRRIRQIKGK
jgi:hypothetical protein